MIRELENFCVEKRLFFQVGRTETAAADFFAKHGGGVFVIVGAPKVGTTSAEVLVRGAAANFIDEIKQVFRRSGSTFVQNGQRFSVTSKIKRPFASGGAGIVTENLCPPLFPAYFGISAKEGTGQATISFDWDETDGEGYPLNSFLQININSGQLVENIVKGKTYTVGERSYDPGSSSLICPAASFNRNSISDVELYRITIHEGQIEIGGDCDMFSLEKPLSFMTTPESATTILPVSATRDLSYVSINDAHLICIQRNYFRDVFFPQNIQQLWLSFPNEYSYSQALSMLSYFGFERPDRSIYVCVGSKWDKGGYGERLYNEILATPSIIGTAIDQEGEYIGPYIPVYKYNSDVC